MEKTAVLNLLKQKFQKVDGGATYINTYGNIPANGLFTSQLTNRPSKGWPKAQYLITSVEEQGRTAQEIAEMFKVMCRDYVSENQVLLLEKEEGTWDVYGSRGELLGHEEYIETLIKPNFKYIAKSDQPLQQIWYGAPGTGKSFTIDGKTSEDNAVRTTFHPDSDYASFVGAYKPTMVNEKLSAYVGTAVHYAQPQGGHSGTESKIAYKFVPQAFLKAYVAAWVNLGEPFYLVIEEINRGNCAQIFGDLFQLLDRNNSGASSYPIHADQDIAQFLADDDQGFKGLSDEQREAIRDFVLVKDNDTTVAIGADILNGKKLLLPPNLHIWATMNTSDQSLFPIDSAFKRRWNWEYMPIKYHPEGIEWKFAVGDKKYLWGDFLEKINPKIKTLTESEDKQMGYFFAKPEPGTDTIAEKVFLNKVLFYLWTDVLKDFALSDSDFQTDDKQPIAFSDFFSDPTLVAKFVAKLGVKEYSEETAEETTPEETTDTADENQ